jgi:hypothetical protein
MLISVRIICCERGKYKRFVRIFIVICIIIDVLKPRFPAECSTPSVADNAMGPNDFCHYQSGDYIPAAIRYFLICPSAIPNTASCLLWPA